MPSSDLATESLAVFPHSKHNSSFVEQVVEDEPISGGRSRPRREVKTVAVNQICVSLSVQFKVVRPYYVPPPESVKLAVI